MTIDQERLPDTRDASSDRRVSRELGGGKGERPVVPPAEIRSYHGLPVLKAPTWKWYIPAYFFTGGTAGAAAIVAGAARVTGNRTLATRASLVAAGAIAASPPLLIADLGRPKRFVNMLRVAKPTSPMSVGTWVLSPFSAAAFGSAFALTTGRIPRLGAVATAAATVLGAPMTTYTAVLVADTAVPAWHEARHRLPFLFAAGALAGGAGATAAVAGPAIAGPALPLAVAGAVGEVVASRWMERGLGELAAPYHSGIARRLTRAAAAASVAGAGLVVAGRRRRAAVAAGGALIAGGALVERLAVMAAGRASALDPSATIAPQRQRAGTVTAP
jgi:hypothetical protein